VLTVFDDEGGLRFEGRSLRCDVSYCAETAVRGALSAVPGVVSVTFGEAGGTDRKMLVAYAGVSRDEVIAGVKRALESVPDPVYDQPIRIVER
jgi:hypothetical protein